MKDCQFGVSPVNYSDSDSRPYDGISGDPNNLAVGLTLYDMVIMVACHTRDRGTNPGGPQSFFTSWRQGNLVRGVVTGYTLYEICKVVAQLGSKR